MIDATVMPPVIRPHIATRTIGGKFCLVNQNRGEAWICSGVSRQIWEKLKQGSTVPEVAHGLAARYSIPQGSLNDTHGSSIRCGSAKFWMFPAGSISAAPNEQRWSPNRHNKDESGKLFALALNANTIFVAWLDLLIPCNLRCRHCYLDFSKTNILPLPKALSILDQLAESRHRGTRVDRRRDFLRKDLLEIVAHAEEKGFLFSLYTNGNFIDEKMADKIESSPFIQYRSAYMARRPPFTKLLPEKRERSTRASMRRAC